MDIGAMKTSKPLWRAGRASGMQPLQEEPSRTARKAAAAGSGAAATAAATSESAETPCDPGPGPAALANCGSVSSTYWCAARHSLGAGHSRSHG